MRYEIRARTGEFGCRIGVLVEGRSQALAKARELSEAPGLSKVTITNAEGLQHELAEFERAVPEPEAPDTQLS